MQKKQKQTRNKSKGQSKKQKAKSKAKQRHDNVFFFLKKERNERYTFCALFPFCDKEMSPTDSNAVTMSTNSRPLVTDRGRDSFLLKYHQYR
jgi:hypothetical protein